LTVRHGELTALFFGLSGLTRALVYNVLSPQATVVRAVLSFVGFAVLVTAAWLLAGPLIVVLGDLPVRLGRGAGQGSEVLSAAVNYLWGMLAVASIVSAMDWWLQRFRFERKIRMTPNELREELKGLRADPKVRWQRNR
jgi:type III secretory pathway component EscU